MSKKTPKPIEKMIENANAPIIQPISETLEKNYMPYTMSVIVSRAIPEIDGLKPSQRKILYTMYMMKLLKGARTKSANVVGQTMKLNPHGDGPIYETMVRLAKGNESLLHPFVDSKGNFGKVTSRDMKYAASRYTEVKLDAICEEMFRDIDKNVVDFVDNYDGKMKEPVLLPTTFPNILVNPNKGIAVGMASSFPSFNLVEVCNTVIAVMKDENAEIHKTLIAPDFPTGGLLLFDDSEIRKIYSTGKGSFRVRAKAVFNKKENLIEITEIPYTTTVEQIIEKIVELIKSGKIREITDVRDETDLKGLRIAIDLKRGTDGEKLLAKLYKNTTLEDSFSCNFNLLIGGRPRVCGVKEIIYHWLDFRRLCIIRASEHDIAGLREKLHLLNGLAKVVLDIDEAIRLIRETTKEKDVVSRLMQHFGIDKIQAEYVADIRLRNLNEEYILSRTMEIEQITKEIDRLTVLIGSRSQIDKVIEKQLVHVMKTYGKERKTQLIMGMEQADEETLPENYNVRVIITKHGYFKKVPLISLRSAGDHKVKDDDEIVLEYDSQNHGEALFFTNKNNVYKQRLYEFEDHKVGSLGTYLPNVFELEENEEILYSVVTVNFAGYMIFAFKNGKVAKVPLSAYKTKQNRRKLVKAYSDEDALVRMLFIHEDIDLTLVRESSKEVRAVVVHSSIIPEKVTKNTRGVQVLRLRLGSHLCGVLISDNYNLQPSKEHFRTDVIPKSGELIDPSDSLIMDRWINN